MSPLENNSKRSMSYKIFAVVFIITDNFHVFTFKGGATPPPLQLNAICCFVLVYKGGQSICSRFAKKKLEHKIQLEYYDYSTLFMTFVFSIIFLLLNVCTAVQRIDNFSQTLVFFFTHDFPYCARHQNIIVKYARKTMEVVPYLYFSTRKITTRLFFAFNFCTIIDSGCRKLYFFINFYVLIFSLSKNVRKKICKCHSENFHFVRKRKWERHCEIRFENENN